MWAIEGVLVLRLEAGQVESLWDEVLPVEVRELPEDLARIDALLEDPALLGPIAACWAAEAVVSGRSAAGHGRPTIAMESYVRLMVVKQRSGWGYETLVKEVSDSLHLRRFCLIGIDRRVPDESTVRKLTRRLGPEAVAEISRLVIAKAQRETRFVGRAVRVDSTVIEADIRYPSDAMLALQGIRALAREGGKLSAIVKGASVRVRDRSRSVGKTVRQISRTLARRTGQAKTQVIELNARAGAQMARSAREARRLAAQARSAARGRGARAKLRAAAKLEQLAGRCEKVAEQIDRRARGLKISDRLVSLSDPDARPIRKGKLGKPTEFGYVAQVAEVTENTRRGARGFILPPASAHGNPAENTLLATNATELERVGLKPRELVGDGGFQTGPTLDALPELAPEQIQLSGRHEPGSRRTRKRRARYRTGIEGRISHLKRGYGLRRSRLKGHEGQRIWTGWAILAYNLDTLAIRTR
ncbi:MAG TPA: transposase [Thermoleophilaceae bacterium]|nr:transposase [Thermoleophilaceae bacterium]